MLPDPLPDVTTMTPLEFISAIRTIVARERCSGFHGEQRKECTRLRRAARAAGATTFVLGVECSQGHLAPRYVSSGACVVCTRTKRRNTIRKDDAEYLRFWQKVDIRAPEECWPWTGGHSTRGGYGVMKFAGKLDNAHRIAMMVSGKSIEDGHWVDHMCRNRGCVNPYHLRSVEPRINAIENSDSPAAINAAKTRCIRGHVLPDDRRCRECRRFRNAQRGAFSRAA